MVEQEVVVASCEERLAEQEWQVQEHEVWRQKEMVERQNYCVAIFH